MAFVVLSFEVDHLFPAFPQVGVTLGRGAPVLHDEVRAQVRDDGFVGIFTLASCDVQAAEKDRQKDFAILFHFENFV